MRAAFVHGMDDALVVSAGFAVAGVLLTLVFLPSVRLRAADSGAMRAKPGEHLD